MKELEHKVAMDRDQRKTVQDDVQPREHARRIAYRSPRLIAFGSLRGLTLGGSSMAGDSGGGKKVKAFFTHGYYDLP